MNAERSWAERIAAQSIALDVNVVRRRRYGLGRKMAPVARSANITPKLLASIERGHTRYVTPQVASRLARALELEPDAVIDFDAPPPPTPHAAPTISMEPACANGLSLRLARWRSRRSRRTVADVLGLPTSALAAAEAGLPIPQWNLRRLAAEVGVEYDEIVRPVTPPEPNP